MAWFVLGLSLLAALLLGGRWLLTADPKVLAKAIRWGAIGIGGAVVLFLGITGRLGWALPFLFLLLMLMRRRPRFGFPLGRGTPSPGQSSDVETEYVTMSLDHDTGMVSGRVLRGRFAGAELAELGFDELIALLAECQLHDEEAARLVASYLDRTQPEDWRERAAAAAGGRGPGGTGAQRMTPEEAYEILGLGPGATAEEIKDAHRRLMQKIHPDHGGSSYLAAKINQAKEILLEL